MSACTAVEFFSCRQDIAAENRMNSGCFRCGGAWSGCSAIIYTLYPQNIFDYTALSINKSIIGCAGVVSLPEKFLQADYRAACLF
jgi:hypothetical protein